ncbi:hypothetical protein ACFPM0_19465 [Pseudonocardia sulfidoxydans]|uniref:hypothetical protein n=1 Tax=Pseudonocardia sulfidoxydans TaxID=54011 RepID=UPI003614C4DA
MSGNSRYSDYRRSQGTHRELTGNSWRLTRVVRGRGGGTGPAWTLGGRDVAYAWGPGAGAEWARRRQRPERRTDDPVRPETTEIRSTPL